MTQAFIKVNLWGKNFQTFCKLDNISGFDKKSIDVPVGKIFGERDITILETLFWPFMNDYKYTNMSKRDFINNIKIIRPWIEEPFEFEKDMQKTT